MDIVASIFLTVVVYLAFPVLFANMREKPITKKQYFTYSYIVNFLIHIFFFAALGSTSSIAYIFWTQVWGSVGLSKLKQRELLIGKETENTTIQKGVVTEGKSLDEHIISDDLFSRAVSVVVSSETATALSLHKAFNLDLGECAVLLDEMERLGIVGKFEGKPRSINYTMLQWTAICNDVKKAYEQECQEAENKKIEIENVAMPVKVVLPEKTSDIEADNENKAKELEEENGGILTESKIICVPSLINNIDNNLKFKFCRRCGFELLKSSTFCSKCGTPVIPKIPKCPSCGKELTEKSVFCHYCGKKV